MEGTLKVSPEQLINASQEFSTQGSTVARLTSEMLQKMTSLSSTWQSEAATAYINKANSLQTDIDKMNKMIQEHVNDLQEMAKQYINADKAAQSEAEALTSNVIG